MREAKVQTLSVEQYLKGELKAKVKHEYIAGQAYAMVGASRRHNLIAGSLYAALRQHIRSPCQVYMSDVKLRIQATYAFYYPGLMVACNPSDNKEYYLEQPQVIVEVLSDTTEAIDPREKWRAYQTLSSLREYLMLHQDTIAAELYLSDDKDAPWRHRNHGSQDDLQLPSIDFSISCDTSIKLPINRSHNPHLSPDELIE